MGEALPGIAQHRCIRLNSLDALNMLRHIPRKVASGTSTYFQHESRCLLDHLLTALFGFNLGVEIGQIAVLLVLIPALDLLFKYVLPERLGIIILSALIAHTAWHWMIERGEQLAKFPFPKIDAAFLASAMRGLIAVLILALAVLLANSWLRRWIGVPKIGAEDVAATPPGKRG